MSFDICVFHASAAPRKPIDFVEWFNQTTDWELTKEYDSDTVCQPDLKEWYHCMLKHYPAMNGRDCESSRQAYLISHPETNGDDAELIVDDLAADYSLTPDLIYAAFNSTGILQKMSIRFPAMKLFDWDLASLTLLTIV